MFYIIFIYYGQVPQTGLLADVNAELVLNWVGSEVIFVTHQVVKSLLKKRGVGYHIVEHGIPPTTR